MADVQKNPVIEAAVSGNASGEAPQSKSRKEGLVRGFAHFVKDYGVIPLAIGVIIANAANDLVKALVDDILTPFISLVTPEGQLQNFVFTAHGAQFKIGLVISALLSFVVVALVVYVAAKFVLRNEDVLKKK